MPSPRKMAFLCFDGFQSLDLSGPLEVFDHLPEAYVSRVFSVSGGMITSSAGLQLHSTKCPALKGYDSLVVVGGAGVYSQLENPAVIHLIQREAVRVRRIISICNGSLLLAQAGLLAGRAATGHWESAHLLQSLCPSVEVRPDAIYVQDGSLWTSAGVTAGMDLALAIVEQDINRDAAMKIARSLVIYYRREGGQSQFSEALKAQSLNSDKFSGLCDYIQQNPGTALDVASLAERVAMSGRNFSRCFAREVGVSPGRYVEQVRVSAARQLLEGSPLSLKVIAQRCGFSGTEILRRVFQKHFNVAPNEFRKRFGCAQ